MKSKCQSCDWIGTEKDMKQVFPDIPHLLQRISPGEPVPQGECPKCGVLCHAIEATKPVIVFSYIASLLMAIRNCEESANHAWIMRHKQAIVDIIKSSAPSGSGIDNGTEIIWSESNPEKLVFNSEYHHMNEGGMYDGWTYHTVIVTPSLSTGFNLKITGKDRNDIKQYLHETYDHWLSSEVKIKTIN